jgi:hypothetical protein
MNAYLVYILLFERQEDKKMKKLIFTILMLIPLSTLTYAQEKRIVLIDEGVLSGDQYFIIARGYPKELNNAVRETASAHDAAVFNAQILAGERFDPTIDVIKNGSPEEFVAGDGYVDVKYVITYPHIKNYVVRKTEPSVKADGSF